MSASAMQQPMSPSAGPAAPMPTFFMRVKKTGIRTNPRPFSCDVASAQSTTVRPQNVYHPTQSVLFSDGFDVLNHDNNHYYPHRQPPAQPPPPQHRLFERKSSGLVSRFGQSTNKMSYSGTPPGKKMMMPQCLLRSSSQHELQKNSVHGADPMLVQQALARSRQGFGGSSPSVPRADPPIVGNTSVPFSMSSSALLPVTSAKAADTDSSSSSSRQRRGGPPEGARGGKGGGAKEESASILKRLRFVGQRTASAISSAGSSSNQSTPGADSSYKDMSHAVSAAGGDSSACANSTTTSALFSSADGGTSEPTDASAVNGLPTGEWRPPNPRLCAYHDCLSLASAWGLGPPVTGLDPRPTGASQAQSPSEDDAGDGKSNELLASCPAFRNELGVEPVRRVALSRQTQCAEEHNYQLFETWHREHTATESGVLENLSNVYLGGRLCAARQSTTVIEPQDQGSYYYRHCFYGRAHHNFFGIDENLGPVAVSMIRESLEKTEAATAGLQSNAIYRLIVRISDLRTMRVAVPEDALPEGSLDATQKSNRTLLRELLELVCPQLSFGCLRPGLTGPKTEELLLKLDEQPIYTRYKVGVMYCRAGQSTEEQMYNNETASPAFDEFLDFLGRRVRLQKFEMYKGGLDTRGDTTGTHSVFEQFQQHQVMFHVSTMLPYTPSNRQQLARKRHIGNDMVTVVFQEPGALPFSPITVRSHFQHVFIIVRVNAPLTDNVTYTVAVARAKDVPAFGPPIPPGATFQKSTELHDFLLTKIINAENAVHRSHKFAAMAARTRREALKDLAENHVAAYGNEGPSRIASRFLGGSVKRKDKTTPRPILAECIRGALSWEVEVQDYSRMHPVQCILGVSADSLVLLERPCGTVLFSTPTHSLIGWSASNNNGNKYMKLYYDHGQLLQLRCIEGSELETVTLLRRLEAVSKGCQVQEMQLRRKPSGQLGFHLHEEGVVTDVEMYGSAWQTGLRQGSRIVEIENIAVSTLNLDQMEGWLKEKPSVRVLVIPPAADGSPRRGCEDPHCPAVKGIDESAFAVADVMHAGRQPPSYAEAFKRLTSTSPGGRTDLGYESAGWSSQAHTDFATVSSASSEERWRKDPPPYGLAPPAPRTDTLSSSGSTSSELSTDHPLHRRPHPSTNRVEPPSQIYDLRSEKGPPLPPKTYKLRQASLSVHEQLANVLHNATTSCSSRRSQLNRTHSEEFLSAVSSTPIHFEQPMVVSARLALAGNPLEPRQPTAWDASVVEAAAKVLASNPEIGSCQLRLQAALQKVRCLEDKVDQLTLDLEKERRLRIDMEKEVSGLKEERRLLKRERMRTENDLRQLLFQREQADAADC